MGRLADFLCEHTVENITDDVVISKRIPFKFKIRAMNSEEFNSYRKLATNFDVKRKKASFDSKKLNEQIIINHTVDPDFRNADDIKKVGCTTPEQYMNKVLLAGEAEELSQQIQSLSGFDLDINEAVEEAKN